MNAYTHEFSWSAPAPLEKTFAALTTPEALRQWFAEHVDIDSKKGGAFKFWGRHTYETPSRAQATQTISAFDPPHGVGFTWTFLGVESEVSFALAEDDSDNNKGGTKITGRHVFQTIPEVVRAKQLIDDLWRLHGGNLITFLKGEGGMLLPDYNDPSPEIRQSVLIDAPREEVFKALITPELLAKWMWAEAAVVEPRQGGKYAYGWNYEVDGKKVAGGPTKILDYVENEKLVTDWPDWRGDASVPVQTITWLLANEGAKTRVTVIHSGFVRSVDFSDYPFGWAGFLGGLKSVVEEQ